MHVLVTGASGFIGRHLVQALLARGHRVSAAQRSLPPDGVRHVPSDFARDSEPAVWRPRLQGVDAVVNTVGIFAEHGAQSFGALHIRTPQALFTACVDVGVRRVLQLSALGADEGASTGYHVSKRTADEFLARLPLSSAIVQPSLVFGADGASSRMLLSLATLPLIPLPGDGLQRVQPIHVDDVVAALVALLAQESWRVGRVPLVGPQPVSLRAYLASLRSQLAVASPLGPARFLPVPQRLASTAAGIAERVPGALINREALQMLARGNEADPAPTTALLCRSPRPVEQFVPASAALDAARTAQLAWLLPLLVLSLAVVWIATAYVSAFAYPKAQSLALLAQVGLRGVPATLALYGAAAFDLVLGLATLASVAMRAAWRRLLWLAQIALMLTYTLIITIWLPEQWLHPFGPILKNVVLLAALVVLYRLEPRG
jgi:uncharacterized protein YbjT (DUF2867 family)